jgi:O-antigen ligase
LEWNRCLIGICILSSLIWLDPRESRESKATPSGDRALSLLLVMLPLWVGLQLVPLPLPLLRVISPARAALAAVAFPSGTTVGQAPLSATPSLTMAHLLRLLSFICVFYLIRELTRRLNRGPNRNAWLAAVPIILIAASEAALGLVQYFRGAVHATGTWVNSNHYSSFLQMSLPFPLALAAIALRRKGTAPLSIDRALLACGLIAIAVLIFAGALYSMSRMGLAAIVLSLLTLATLWVTRRSPERKAAARVVLSASAVFAVVIVSTPGTLLARFASSDQDPLTGEIRFRIWHETLRLITDYPVFGSGLGSYASVFQKYSVSAPMFLVDFAHNDYLQLMAELGVIGFAIAAATALLILIRILKSAYNAGSSAQRMVSAACAAGLLALLLDSSVDFDFYIPANAMLAAWLAGIGTAGAE